MYPPAKSDKSAPSAALCTELQHSAKHGLLQNSYTPTLFGNHSLQHLLHPAVQFYRSCRMDSQQTAREQWKLTW